MKTFEEAKEQYLLLGYKTHWGDGAVDSKDLCILRKTIEITDIHTSKIIRKRYDYVILSLNNRTVDFYDVSSYSS